MSLLTISPGSTAIGSWASPSSRQIGSTSGPGAEFAIARWVTVPYQVVGHPYFNPDGKTLVAVAAGHVSGIASVDFYCDGGAVASVATPLAQQYPENDTNWDGLAFADSGPWKAGVYVALLDASSFSASGLAVIRAEVVPVNGKTRWLADSWFDTDGSTLVWTTDACRSISLPITGVVRTSNVVVATIPSLSVVVGDRIWITGVTDSSFNGLHTVTAVTGTTVTFSQVGSNGSSSGGLLSRAEPLPGEGRLEMTVNKGDMRLRWARVSPSTGSDSNTSGTYGVVDSQSAPDQSSGVLSTERFATLSSAMIAIRSHNESGDGLGSSSDTRLNGAVIFCDDGNPVATVAQPTSNQSSFLYVTPSITATDLGVNFTTGFTGASNRVRCQRLAVCGTAAKRIQLTMTTNLGSLFYNNAASGCRGWLNHVLATGTIDNTGYHWRSGSVGGDGLWVTNYEADNTRQGVDFGGGNQERNVALVRNATLTNIGEDGVRSDGLLMNIHLESWGTTAGSHPDSTHSSADVGNHIIAGFASINGLNPGPIHLRNIDGTRRGIIAVNVIDDCQDPAADRNGGGMTSRVMHILDMHETIIDRDYWFRVSGENSPIAANNYLAGVVCRMQRYMDETTGSAIDWPAVEASITAEGNWEVDGNNGDSNASVGTVGVGAIEYGEGYLPPIELRRQITTKTFPIDIYGNVRDFTGGTAIGAVASVSEYTPALAYKQRIQQALIGVGII